MRGGLGGGGGGGYKFTKHSNAYMLVYVRKCQWEQYMCRVTKEDIAPYLRGRLEVQEGGLGGGALLWGSGRLRGVVEGGPIERA